MKKKQVVLKSATVVASKKTGRETRALLRLNERDLLTLAEAKGTMRERPRPVVVGDATFYPEHWESVGCTSSGNVPVQFVVYIYSREPQS